TLALALPADKTAAIEVHHREECLTHLAGNLAVGEGFGQATQPLVTIDKRPPLRVAFLGPLPPSSNRWIPGDEYCCSRHHRPFPRPAAAGRWGLTVRRGNSRRLCGGHAGRGDRAGNGRVAPGPSQQG